MRSSSNRSASDRVSRSSSRRQPPAGARARPRARPAPTSAWSEVAPWTAGLGPGDGEAGDGDVGQRELVDGALGLGDAAGCGPRRRSAHRRRPRRSATSARSRQCMRAVVAGRSGTGGRLGGRSGRPGVARRRNRRRAPPCSSLCLEPASEARWRATGLTGDVLLAQAGRPDDGVGLGEALDGAIEVTAVEEAQAVGEADLGRRLGVAGLPGRARRDEVLLRDPSRGRLGPTRSGRRRPPSGLRCRGRSRRERRARSVARLELPRR